MLPLFPSSNGYNRAPAADELEVAVIGPGFGEAIAVHVGDGKWFLIDSCVDDADPTAATLRYFNDIGVAPASVFAIIVSHWDDDHCKGMSQVVRSCSNAELAMSGAFVAKDFLAYVAAYKSPLTAGARSGVKEIKETVEELRKSSRTKIKQTGDSRRLFGPGSISVSHGQNIEIWSLAPSDFEYSNFMMWVASQMPAIGETRRVATKRIRNDLSTVIHLTVGEDVIIFGGDLEEEGRSETGWSAVVASTGRPTSKAQLFKVSHHGSATGEHPSIWSDLLTQEPIAVIAPFRNGGVSLPHPDDVTRTLGHTPNAFATTTLRQTANPPIDRTVEKTIKDVTKRYSTIKPKPGMVRARKTIGTAQAWNIEMFGDAAPLAKIR